MKKKQLTTAEKDEIIALFKDGNSVAKIAKAYGRARVTEVVLLFRPVSSHFKMDQGFI